MTVKSTLIWSILFLTLAGVIYNSTQSSKENKAKEDSKKAIEQSQLKTRFEKGAYVANQSKLSEYEVAKTIIYPSKSMLGDYDEMYDTSCIVYINTQLNQAKMKCTGLLIDGENDNNEMQDVEPDKIYGRYE